LTVIADHGAPVGVSTLRSFRMRAISRARLAFRLGEDRGQHLGSLAVLNALRLLCGERIARALGDQPAFFLGQGGKRCSMNGSASAPSSLPR
jgi:hypothetical protein